MNFGELITVAMEAMIYLDKYADKFIEKQYKEMFSEMRSIAKEAIKAEEKYGSKVHGQEIYDSDESEIRAGFYKCNPECSIGIGIRELSEEEQEIIRKRKERREKREQHNKGGNN